MAEKPGSGQENRTNISQFDDISFRREQKKQTEIMFFGGLNSLLLHVRISLNTTIDLLQEELNFQNKIGAPRTGLHQKPNGEFSVPRLRNLNKKMWTKSNIQSDNYGRVASEYLTFTIQEAHKLLQEFEPPILSPERVRFINNVITTIRSTEYQLQQTNGQKEIIELYKKCRDKIPEEIKNQEALLKASHDMDTAIQSPAVLLNTKTPETSAADTLAQNKKSIVLLIDTYCKNASSLAELLTAEKANPDQGRIELWNILIGSIAATVESEIEKVTELRDICTEGSPEYSHASKILEILAHARAAIDEQELNPDKKEVLEGIASISNQIRALK